MSAPGWTKATGDVLAERQRQLEVESWTSDHDDCCADGKLAMAAAVYALPEALREISYRHTAYLHNGRAQCDDIEWVPTAYGEVPKWWLWHFRWWKPKSRREDLVRAGALIIAEIDRLDRAALAKARGDQ